MSTAPAGSSFQRSSLPAKTLSRTGSAVRRPHPNPPRPHKPPGQNANPRDSQAAQIVSFSQEVGSGMDLDSSGPQPDTEHASAGSTEQDSFMAAVLGSQTQPQNDQAPVGRKIPFPARSTRNADNTLAAIGRALPSTKPNLPCPLPTNHHRQTDAATKAGDVEMISDCHPWIGKHNEDKLSEQVIKLGFTEKQRFPTEGNTARPTVCAHLSKGAGLQALSTLFVSVLQQRKEAGLITAQTSFKPPPRVTLTDSKREAWLRDLADEKCPLRRLSRTIPHGIRGKTLLEHCQNKQVPLPRATWLVRCVGANELRAFRRKGVSVVNAGVNEVKWIKEWTSTITSFIEDSISLTRTSDARQRIFYASKLATQLFAESLLDQESFLTWLLGFFETSTVERLPIACLLVQIFWQHLIRDFDTCRQLARICATRLVSLPRPRDRNILEPLRQRLNQMLESLMSSAPATLIFGDSWTTTRPALVAVADTASAVFAAKLHETIECNDCIARLIPDSPGTQTDPRLAFINLLDAYDFSYATNVLFDKCVKTAKSKTDAIALAMRYATSVTRSRPTNIPLSAALMRETVTTAAELTPLLLKQLAVLRDDSRCCPLKMSILLADLSSTGHFDLRQYLKWVMTGGIFNRVSKATLNSSVAARFVLDMPIDGLPENTRSLRRMLLQAIQAYEDEAQNLAAAQAFITARLPGIFGNSSQGPSPHGPDPHAFVKELNLTTSRDLSAWLATKVRGCIESTTKTKPSQTSADCPMTSEEYVLLRTMFESSHSIVNLMDIVEILLGVCDMDLLPCLLDTLYAWRNMAKVLGKFDVLVQSTLARYRILRSRNAPVRELVLSLMRLVTSDSKYARIKTVLDPEVEICSQNAGAMAYTPASEVMVDASEAAGSLEHEIERLMSSGITLDAQSVNSVFDLLNSHIKVDRKHVLAIMTNSGTLLARLADCAPAAFGKAIMNWLKEAAKVATASELFNLVVSLVGSGTLSLHDAIDSVKLHARNIRMLLQKPAEDAKEIMCKREYYCYRTEVCDLLQAEPLYVLDAMLSSHQNGRIDSLESDTSIHRLLWAAAVRSTEGTVTLLRPYSKDSLDSIQSLLCHSLDPSGQLSMTLADRQSTIQSLFQNVDQVALPLYQVLIQIMSSSDVTFIKQVEAAVLAAISNGGLCWPEMISSAGSTMANTVRQQAEEHLFKCRPDFQRFANRDPVASDLEKRTRQDLDVLSATAYSVGQERLPSCTAKIVSQLGIVARYVATTPNPDQSRQPPRDLAVWTEALLRLALVHRSSFTAAAGAQDLQKLLYATGIIMTASPALVDQTVSTFAYEVAAYLIAGNGTANAAQLQPSLEAHIARHAGARFLFGRGENKHAWLHVITAARPVGPTVSQQPPQATAAQRSAPFMLRPFELLPDSTPHIGANDTALSLRLFGARKGPRVGD